MDDLEDEAAVTGAELEGGDGVGLRVGLIIGPPLDIQAHHEVVAAADAVVVGEPRGDSGGVGGEEGVDYCVVVAALEGDFVEVVVVGVEGEVVVHHAHRDHWVHSVLDPKRHAIFFYHLRGFQKENFREREREREREGGFDFEGLCLMDERNPISIECGTVCLKI